MNIIAAIGRNRAIGKDNKLLWHIPEDFSWMKEHTNGHPIIMGRKTAQSIGRPLPNRTNIVVTSNKQAFPDPYVVVDSLEEGVATASRIDPTAIFIFGGASIYEQTIPIADRLFLTIVDADFDADTFFPSYQDFTRVEYERDSSNDQYSYRFLILTRDSDVLPASTNSQAE